MENRHGLTEKKAVLNSGECSKCNGDGWIYHSVEKEGYKTPLIYAEPCPMCRVKRRISNAGIPEQFSAATIDKFRYDVYKADMSRFKKVVDSFFQDFRKWQANETGLYLWSTTPGSGKTFLACALGRSIAVKYDLKMLFVSVVDYLDILQRSFKDQGGQDPAVYRECDLLVLDDIGAQKRNDWYDQEIFRLVDARMRSGALTIYTANIRPEDLNISDRTADRIRSKSVVLQMPEESIRNRQAEEKQNAFLEQLGVL